MDESTLIEQCLKGSSLAQKKLFEKFAPKMLFVCQRYCKNTEEAEDVLQEGFVKIFQSLPKYTNQGTLEGWMRRIFVNTALDILRKEKNFKLNSSLSDVDFMISNNEKTSDNIEAEDLLKLISNMPKGYQIVFNMFAVEGYSHKEIAELLSITEETSKSQYFRARTYLRKQLEKNEEVLENKMQKNTIQTIKIKET
jgi:RNA polymerase sigma factor (sigma-70 family)